MAEQLGGAVLTLSVDDSQLKAGLQAAQRQATTAGRSIEQAFSGTGKPLQSAQGIARISNEAASAVGGVGKLGAALSLVGAGISGAAVLGFAKDISEVGNAAEAAEVRLKALTGRFGETVQAQQLVANAARTLNLSTTEASNGFAQLYGALRPTGVSLNDVETIFVGLTAAAKNFGLSGDAVNNTLIQLTQGLASGRLQGDELRSVLEQLPPLSQALAKELNAPVGSLKQLGEQGKITSNVIIKALEQLKATELGSLDAALNTSTERIKAANIEWEQFRINLAKGFGGFGNDLLLAFKGTFSFINSLDLTEGQKAVQAVEAEIAKTIQLINAAKSYQLDTSDAEARLRDLERRLNNLKGRSDVNSGNSRAFFAERQRLVNLANQQERELGGFGASGISFGPIDFSTRALIEGLNLAEKQGKKVFQGLEQQISALRERRIELPLDATADRAQIDAEIAALEKRLESERATLLVRIDIDKSRQYLDKVNKALATDPGNPNLRRERDELLVQIAELETRLTGKTQEIATAASGELTKSQQITKSYQERVGALEAVRGLEGVALQLMQQQLNVAKLRSEEQKASAEYTKALAAAGGDQRNPAVDAAAQSLAKASGDVKVALIEGSTALEQSAREAARELRQASLDLRNSQQLAATPTFSTGEAGPARAAVQQVQGIRQSIAQARQAQQDAARSAAQAFNNGLRGDALQTLVNATKAAGERLKAAIVNGADALRSASRQAAEALKQARLELAGIQADPQGLNQYLPAQAGQDRMQQALQSILPAFRSAQRSFERLTGYNAPEFQGSTASVLDAVQQFIQRVDREQRAVENVQLGGRSLETINAELATSSNNLANQIAALAAKNWSVNVNVAPNGSVSSSVGALNGTF